jgi:hypothetical protein
VESEAVQDEQTLRAQLARARALLDGLVGDLRAADAELDGLSGERQQQRLLLDACAALEQLGQLGGARLFWGERADEGEIASHFRQARGRADAFQKRVHEIEERRQGLLDQIEHHESGAFLIADELLDLEEQAERQKHEWIIEREADLLPAYAAVLPWMRNSEEDRRFRKSLTTALAVSALFALLVSWFQLPPPQIAARPELPERLTRLIVEQKKQPAPPPVQVAAVAPQKLAEPPKAPKPKDGPGQGPSKGPGVGPGSGILAFRDQLAFTQNQNLSRLGAQAHLAPGAVPAGPVERAMLTTNAPGSSGGINLAELSRNVSGGGGGGGGNIAGVQVARATSTIAGGGGGSRGEKVGNGGPGPARTDEEIQIVFDRHKSALYRLYNRELRVDPTLKGQMVLRIRIEPDGSVSLCELQASDMRAPQLAAQVVERVRGFDFGAKEVPAVTILYPIDFLPAA